MTLVCHAGTILDMVWEYFWPQDHPPSKILDSCILPLTIKRNIFSSVIFYILFAISTKFMSGSLIYKDIIGPVASVFLTGPSSISIPFFMKIDCYFWNGVELRKQMSVVPDKGFFEWGLKGDLTWCRFIFWLPKDIKSFLIKSILSHAFVKGSLFSWGSYCSAIDIDALVISWLKLLSNRGQHSGFEP